MFFFFNDTAPTEIYTLSLHDALPISGRSEILETVYGARRATGGTVQVAGRRLRPGDVAAAVDAGVGLAPEERKSQGDRKSTRLNSSHANISYAVFCLKKKKI